MSHVVDDLFEQSYRDVVRLAHFKLAREQAPISTGTLAHEIYLGLRGREDLSFASREQFLSYASKAMRSLLVDMARERLAQKRSSELLPLTLADGVADIASGTPEQILAMNQALERLGQVDARLLQVAEMRAVMGMDHRTIAHTLGLSEPTIKRDWQRAKAFLTEQLRREP